MSSASILVSACLDAGNNPWGEHGQGFLWIKLRDEQKEICTSILLGIHRESHFRIILGGTTSQYGGGGGRAF